MSKAFLKTTVGLVSAYGIASSAIESRCAIGARPRAVALVERELVQGQRLARVESDARAPRPPRERVAVEREARALGLRDLDRPQIVAVRAPAAVAVVAGRLGHGQRAVVVDAHHLHGVEVDERDQPADRARVAVVAREIAAQPRQRAGDAPARLLEEADRPGVDHHELDVVDAPQLERPAEAGVGLHGDLGLGVLVARDRRLHAGHVLEGHERVAVQRHDGLVRLATCEHDERRLARRYGAAVTPRRELLPCPVHAARRR